MLSVAGAVGLLCSLGAVFLKISPCFMLYTLLLFFFRVLSLKHR